MSEKEKFSKLYVALKFRLHGAKMFKALKALECAREVHQGLRKDGVTPEFQHQLEIALYLLTLKDIGATEEVVIAALLHDSMEDYPEKMDRGWLLKEFGEESLKTLDRLNKKNFKGMEEYLEALSMDPVGSLVKLADRVHNVQSMNRGKFSIEKQKKYAQEVVDWFLPMAKKARKRFPNQMDAYYNLENMLKSQYELVMILVHSQERDLLGMAEEKSGSNPLKRKIKP